LRQVNYAQSQECKSQAYNPSYPYDENTADAYYKLYLPHDPQPHGYMHPEVVKKMPWTPDFKLNHEARTVALQDASEGKTTSATCDAAFAKVITALIDQDLFEVVHGQHSELSLVLSAKYPVKIERFTRPLFGFVGCGAHLTAYTRTAAGLKIWVPRRSPHLKTYPDKLDTTVAGGVKADESPFETIIHEAEEEASLPTDLLRRDVRSTGVLTYMSTSGENENGESGLVKPDAIYVYDIELSEGVVPRPGDDEVKEFYLMGVKEVKNALAAAEFKTNSAVVMLDFFIRHGIISADNEEDFVEIRQRMHRRLPFSVVRKRN
jgi:8-oxo-dGTP pyrophosphatase MutT (NUDIX family)